MALAMIGCTLARPFLGCKSFELVLNARITFILTLLVTPLILSALTPYAVAANYDRTRVLAYTQAFALRNTNDDAVFYDGDCAHFAAHAVNLGLFDAIRGNIHTAQFTLASRFESWLNNTLGARQVTFVEVSGGDIITTKGNGPSGRHCFVVEAFVPGNPNDILISSHTTNRYRKSFNAWCSATPVLCQALKFLKLPDVVNLGAIAQSQIEPTQTGCEECEEATGSCTVPGSVGGSVLSVDKLGLLAPYIGFASVIAVATVLTAVYLKRVKKTNSD